jgi:hypothetical protein
MTIEKMEGELVMMTSVSTDMSVEESGWFLLNASSFNKGRQLLCHPKA